MNKLVAIGVFSLLLVSQISLFQLLILYTVVVAFLAAYSFFSGRLRMDFGVFLFATICFLSIIMNDIPAFFKPYSRYAYLLLLLVGCSSLFYNKKLVRFRRCLMLNICSISVVMTLLSFAGYIGGFGYWAGNVGYWGVALHGNILGVFGMISLIYSAFIFFNTRNNRKYVFLAIAGISFIILLLASSRNAVACSIIGLLCLLKLHFREKSSKFITTIAILIIAAMVIYPYLGNYTVGIETKMAYGEEYGSITASRSSLWNTRIEEFRRYPVIGVGTFAIDTSIMDSEKFFNPYNRVTGVVELGSTYLGLLSQNGVLGFLSFVGIVLVSLRRGYKKATCKYDNFDVLFFSILVSFVFHMNFEGYVNTAGQILTFILWLVIGCNSYYPIKAKYKTIKGIIYY